jgi:AcrR family transcriptional regulator
MINKDGREMTGRKDNIQTRSSATRLRLLDAAAELFARRGYWNATVAEICGKAKANIAAVNYHFRNKETLYMEAWRHAFTESIKKHPPDGGIPPEAPPEQRLRGHIAAFLQRIADPKNHEFPIVQKELSNPTGLLADMIHLNVEPLFLKMESIIRELFGPGASDRDIHYCMISISSQCLDPMAKQRSDRPKIREKHKGPRRIDDLDSFIDHVVEFSLAGVGAIRSRHEAGSAGASSRQECEKGEKESL